MRISAFPCSSRDGRGRLIGPEQSVSVVLGLIVLASLWTLFTAAEQCLELTKRTKVSSEDTKLMGLRRIVRGGFREGPRDTPKKLVTLLDFAPLFYLTLVVEMLCTDTLPGSCI